MKKYLGNLFLLILSSFLFAVFASGQQGSLFNYLRINPTVIPTKCTVGDIRINSSNSVGQLCTASNTWNQIAASASTAGGIIYGNGTGFGTTSAGATGQVLTSNGSNAPTWGGGVTGNYAKSYYSYGITWQTTSATWSDFVVHAGSTTFGTRISNGITLNPLSNLPGVSFFPAASTAVYFISADFGSDISNIGVGAAIRLVDSNSNVIGTASIYQSTGALPSSYEHTITGVWAPNVASGSSVSVKLQGACDGTNGVNIDAIHSGASALEITVIRIN